LGVEAIVGHLFHQTDDYHRLYAELPDMPFKVNFDPSHLIVQNEDPMRVIRELGKHINHVHLKDGKGTYPAFEFPPIGQGAIDFDAIAQGLRDIGYKGALSVEYEAQVFGYALSETDILQGGLSFVDAITRERTT
jgi:sugar phosphate isomerase/epimerase